MDCASLYASILIFVIQVSVQIYIKSVTQVYHTSIYINLQGGAAMRSKG